MILFKNNVFYLNTKDTSYVIRVEETKHLVLEHYGDLISTDVDPKALFNKWSCGVGSEVVNNKELSASKTLDLMTLELSTTGKGDYNSPSVILKNKNGYVFDFLFEKYEINKKIKPLKDLPTPHDGDNELIITLLDKSSKIEIELHYIVFEKANVIARNIVILNKGTDAISVLKGMSYMLTLNNNDYEILNLYGIWNSECNKEYTTIKHGLYVNDSKTGASSNRHNPFFMIKNKDASFDAGEVYAFNLVYSGNHYESVEENVVGQVRIEGGISPFCFDYALKANESFETPFAVMTYSSKGMNKASQNMHYFVNNHIVSGPWENKPRPILINNWEATDFKFDQSKLMKIAKTAKDCGIELFVLDDGWFKGRDTDKAGLGDYEVNKKKLHSGLNGLAKKINKLGMKFGLWFEPEMVNPDSDLYRNHPEYAITHPGFKPSEGRNQLCLNLALKEVQDYIIENVNKVLDSANISYVKWDYNRPITDFYLENGETGKFFYDYIVGLYRILKEVTSKHKEVLFEGCSSGGNRFDLGILSYFEQNWASDDTDAYERNFIQSGLYLGYPQSTIGAHVSAVPSHSALRVTPIDTRFNIASFGCLGYELDLNHLTPLEIKFVKNQVSFYKKHRELLQFGTLYQFSFMEKSNHSELMVLSEDKKEAIIGYFNGLQTLRPGVTRLIAKDFNDKDIYKVSVRPQEHNLKLFGGLINFVLPVRLNENGAIINTISKHKGFPIEKEEYIVSGSMLNNGAIKLNQEWTGAGIGEDVRVLGDFGSRLYFIKKEESK